MTVSRSLFDFINKFLPISREEFDQLISPIARNLTVPRKTILTKPGDMENNIYFIRQGLVRKYYKKATTEINTQISHEGQVIHVQESFYSRLPSEFYVETIEPSEIVSIAYDDLEKLYASSHKMEHLGRLVATITLVLNDKWQVNQIKLSPRERFVYFFTQHSELVQRVPQKYLASFLNIKPETFSRFKHLLKENYTKEVLSSR